MKKSKNKFKRIVASTLAAATVVTAGGLAVKNQIKHSNDIKYIVQPGDTFSGLSDKFFDGEISAEELARYNHKKNPDKLNAYEEIVLPAGAKNGAKYEDETYVVQPGDNLTLLCEKFYNDSSYETIIRFAIYNGIDPDKMDFIQIGQVLKKPQLSRLQNIEIDKVIKRG